MKNNLAVLPNGDLFFTYVDQEDIKKFSVYPFNLQLQCIVASRDIIYYSHIYNLKVVGNDSSSFSPTFAPGGEPMQMETAVQGKEKFLHCVASGNPAPQTRWYRVFENGKTKEIVNGKDGILIPRANHGRVLHILKISKEQHEPGNYRCEVSNGQGKTLVSKLIKITVYSESTCISLMSTF
ncbi:neurofascin-like [Actinia tenebrosa]|uniref:Neurofascin-like n=1 Tax=Actinia tenebrosa TaxID=6105 RepID=A0A6P8HCE8_ACTTE|nr:neurofascin-like [Actinia tenebrosa]